MVYYHNSISLCKPTALMGSSNYSLDPPPKSKHNKKTLNSFPASSKIPICDKSRSAALDIVIMIAVISSCGYLLFPFIKFIIIESSEIVEPILYLIGEEVSHAPLIYGSIGLSIFCASLVVWCFLIGTTRKCGNPNCKGFRKAAEFDIQLETEECVKNNNNNNNGISSNGGGGVKKGLFEFPKDHYSELEAELKKMAPPNGRAVLVFKARCGCSVGRLEVPGPKKMHKRIKK